MMEFVNEFLSQDVRPKAVMEPFVLMLSPFAPHLAEELWELLGHSKTLAYEPWPVFDEKYLIETEVEIPVQLNGKLRGKVTVATGADQSTIEGGRQSRFDNRVTTRRQDHREDDRRTGEDDQLCGEINL